MGISISTAVRAARAFDRSGEDGLALISRALAVSLCSILAADFFLAAEYSKLLWLLISLGPAFLAVAQESEAEERAATAMPQLAPAHGTSTS